MSSQNSIGLAELIAKVRQELLSTENTADVPLFSVDEVKLELQVTVTKEGEAGLHIEVVELGGKVSREDVHKIEVTLTPLVAKEKRATLFQERYPNFWKKIEDKSLEPALNKGQADEDLTRSMG